MAANIITFASLKFEIVDLDKPAQEIVGNKFLLFELLKNNVAIHLFDC